MNVFKNPFYVLGASSRHSRRRISALAEEKAFLSDPEAVNEARNALLIPQKRLAAEMRWFPGVEDAKVKEILSALQALQGEQVPERMEFSGLNSIALLNFGVYTFCFRHFGDVAGISQSILTIDEVFEDLDIDTLYEEINDDREAAGFPEAEEAEIEDEFLNYRDDVVKSLSSKLTTLPLENYMELSEDLAKNLTENSVILGGMLDEYELYIAPHMEEEKQRILGTASDIDTDLETLCSLIREWGRLALPLHLATTPRRLKRERLYQDEEEIFHAVRSLALELHNKYDRTEDALQLTLVLEESLAEFSDKFQDVLDEDLKALQSLMQRKREQKIREAQAAAAMQKQKEKMEAEKRQRAKMVSNERARRLALLEDLKPQIIETAKYIQFYVDADLTHGIQLLLSLIEKWDTLSRPLLSAAMEHDKIHKNTEEIIFSVWELASSLYIQHSRLKESLQLVLALKKYFAYFSPDFAALLDDHIKILQSLLQSKEDTKNFSAEQNRNVGEEKPDQGHREKRSALSIAVYILIGGIIALILWDIVSSSL